MCDSGASHNMATYQDPLWAPKSQVPVRGAVITASNERLKIVGKGPHPVLGPTYTVKGLKGPLHSVPSDAKMGLWTIFGPRGMKTVTQKPHIKGRIVRTGVLHGNRYYLTPKLFKFGGKYGTDLAIGPTNNEAPSSRPPASALYYRKGVRLKPPGRVATTPGSRCGRPPA